jgi:hypothetical protein
MRRIFSCLRFAAISICLFALGHLSVQAQTQSRGNDYSDSTELTRSRTARSATEASPAKIIRSARMIYIEPNKYIDATYLEYKLGKQPEFQQWKLAIVKKKEKADLVLNIHRRALNYIFSIEDPKSSIIVVNGKVVAINDLVAAEDIAKEIIKRMKATRALPSDEIE